MSGHSKWANIKNRKGKADAQKGKIFTKLGRELLIAIKEGGADLNTNFKLKEVVTKCKINNMPNDTIDRSIKKALGDGTNTIYEEMIYEGYGPSGVALIVNTTTDNRNRTAAEVRHLFSKFSGNLGAIGSVSYLFDKKGRIIIEKENLKLSEDDLMMICLEIETEDMLIEDEYYEILTKPEDFSRIIEELEKHNLVFLEAEIQMLPKTSVILDEDSSRKMELLIEKLDELDDVVNVYHNWEE